MARPIYTNHGDNVRVSTQYDPHRSEDVEVVERWTGGQWRVERTFGHMSNDFALTEAKNCARMLAFRSPIADRDAQYAARMEQAYPHLKGDA